MTTKTIQILDGISGRLASDSRGMWQYSLITDGCIACRSEYRFATRADAMEAMEFAAERLADDPVYSEPSHG